MADDLAKIVAGKKSDGIVGLLTSKRAWSAVIGIIATVLAAWKGIDIDPKLRMEVVLSIWKITVALVGGFSLSDTFGKGKVAAQMRHSLMGLVKSGLDIAAAVTSKPDAAASPEDDGGGPSE